MVLLNNNVIGGMFKIKSDDFVWFDINCETYRKKYLDGIKFRYRFRIVILNICLFKANFTNLY
jgi:hypothetical protein